MPTDLLVATTSRDKLREWRGLLDGLPLRLLTLRDVGIDSAVEETGATFEENARLKADAYGAASGLLTLAEDSGLEVRALNNQPGVYSARWEGDDYAHKNALLVRLLEGRSGRDRACAYRCVVAVRAPEGRIWVARGSVLGRVATAPRGTRGFGYDPIFYVPRLGRTLAEVSVEEKDRISHRGRAAARVRPILQRLVESGAPA